MLVDSKAIDNEGEVAAVLGGEPRPSIMLSGLVAEYESLQSARLRQMSEGQVRKWRNPKKRAATNLIAVIGDKATIRLASGAEFATAATHGVGNGMEVTVAVRPERLSLTGPAGGVLQGRVDNIVYFGTDTTYQVALPDGIALNVRAQNRDGARPRFAVGDTVGVELTAEALQVLRD